MPDYFTETHSTGFLGNLGGSIKGVFVGLLFFVASFPVLWMIEGCVNMGEVAKASLVAPADRPDPVLDGRLVSVTQSLESTETLGDPRYIMPGPYISLDRKAEMYAWVERKESKTDKNVGGGSTTTTTYRYEREWTSHPASSSSFHHPAGHENPQPRERNERFVVREATVGAYSFAPAETEGGLMGHGLPSGEALALSPEVLAIRAAADSSDPERPRLIDSYLYFGTGTPSSPALGDTRISFSVLKPGRTVTLFGKQAGTRIVAHLHDGKHKLFRALNGSREEAIQALLTEHSIMVWIGRAVGFILMWAGMCMVFGPISAVMDVLPFLGNASRTLISIVLFPVAAVLSIVTIVVAKVFHSPIALAVVVGGILLGGFLMIRGRRPRTA